MSSLCRYNKKTTKKPTQDLSKILHFPLNTSLPSRFWVHVHQLTLRHVWLGFSPCGPKLRLLNSSGLHVSHQQLPHAVTRHHYKGSLQQLPHLGPQNVAVCECTKVSKRTKSRNLYNAEPLWNDGARIWQFVFMVSLLKVIQCLFLVVLLCGDKSCHPCFFFFSSHVLLKILPRSLVSVLNVSPHDGT